MDVLEAISTRRSIRKYTPEPVAPETVETLLRAAMLSPTASNGQCWRFVVINDREILSSIRDIHPYAAMTAQAPLAILVCGDITVGHNPEYWNQDCAAAIQTLMLAARSMDLGSVWLGIHPHEEREKPFIEKFGLPGTVRPLGLVVIGYPAQPFSEEDRYDPDKVHYNQW